MAATEKTGTAKNNDKPKAEETKPQASSLPAGYLSAASDAVGFYDPDMRADGNDKGKGKGIPIHFVPMHVILADSKIESDEPSVLIFARLIDPCAAIRDGNGEGKVAERPVIETKRGDVVGIWFSAGMRDLVALGGAKVYMVQQDAGDWKAIKNKPSKMKSFDIGHDPSRPGSKLTVREDRRKDSAGVEAKPFAGRKAAGAAAVDSGDAQGDDDIPF